MRNEELLHKFNEAVNILRAIRKNKGGELDFSFDGIHHVVLR